MRIAFYAPLKSPHHPVPSGDRSMARLLLESLTMAGHAVTVVSELRSLELQGDRPAQEIIEDRARAEGESLLRSTGPRLRPDIWVTYHHYYKAPDFIGPRLAGHWDIPYVVIEASHAPKRLTGPWADWAHYTAETINQASRVLAMTAFDRACLEPLVGIGRLISFPPFIKAEPYLETTMKTRIPEEPCQLLTVAMMRPGDKLESYRRLARALALVDDRNWHLTIAGDGPASPLVKESFHGFTAHQVSYLGKVGPDALPGLYSRSNLFLWPGAGEAYGMVYLEAAASGLPAVAQAIRGVPDVVIDGQTGHLTPDGDDRLYAGAIASLISDPGHCAKLGRAAREFVAAERDIPKAAERLNSILREAVA